MNIVLKFITFFVSILFVGTTYADAAPVQQPGGMFGQGFIFLIIIVMMYFLMIRPQNKKAKEHKNLIDKLAENDEVLTTGGIIGKIKKVTDTFVVITISDNVAITVQKQSIVSALPKGTIKSI